MGRGDFYGSRPPKKGETDYIRCKICGKLVARYANINHVAQSYCHRCSGAIYYTWRKTGQTRNECVQMLMDQHEAERRRNKREKPETHHCPYCGRLTLDGRTYCSFCVMTGQDKLHAVLGKTSGWDKPQSRVVVPVKMGWRGQKCAGGGRSEYVMHNHHVWI